jgi:hypothetical protein
MLYLCLETLFAFIQTQREPFPSGTRNTLAVRHTDYSFFRLKEPSGLYTTLSLSFREYPFLQPHTEQLCVRSSLSACLQLHRSLCLQPRTSFSTTDWLLFRPPHRLPLSSALLFTFSLYLQIFRHGHKFLKATFSSVMSVCLSVCLSFRMDHIRSHRKYFHEILYLRVVRKFVRKIQISLKSDNNSGYFAWRPR